MQTYVVEVLNEKAISLLRDLESIDIIRLHPAQEQKPIQRLSEQFRNTISPEVAADLHRQVAERRK